MVLRLLLFCLLNAVFAQKISSLELLFEFNKFTKNYNKKYVNSEETRKKFNNFVENYQYILKHNSNYKNFKLEVNENADKSFDTAPQAIKIPMSCRMPHISVKTTENIDWRTTHKVDEEKRDEETCQSSWAFSVIGAVESLNVIRNPSSNYIRYSIQELIDCSGGIYGNKGCEGGGLSQSFTYIRIRGISTEAEYPYIYNDGFCKKVSNSFHISGCVAITPKNNTMLLEALNIGPVSVMIRSYNREWEFYKAGVIHTGCGTDNDILDRAVLLVGAGFDGNIPCWIIKNSKSIWGQRGYAQIYRHNVTNSGICGIALAAAYPVY